MEKNVKKQKEQFGLNSVSVINLLYITFAVGTNSKQMTVQLSVVVPAVM